MRPKWELIGHVGVDSGQLLVTDPCYLNGWKNADYQDVRRHEDTQTKRIYQYRVDFENYESVLDIGMTVNAALASGRLRDVPIEFPPSYDYNGVSHAAYPHGSGVIPFDLGHDGRAVAFSSGYGDGYYPVYAHRNHDGRVVEVRIVMDNEEMFNALVGRDGPKV